MSPLGIEIMLHYHARASDYRDGDHSARAVSDLIEQFLRCELLEPTNQERGELNYVPCKYRCTSRGRAYVDALQAIPFPTVKWIIDWPQEFQP